ncbi:BAG family molecular chaperone regulator 2 [Dermacentor andersoni]|uniref:BAG family molecular chaperone regulator 2 n=1 Tax=Dermacentor andersoni TaxID=34620 RepID=UPI002155A3F0|nr:BAG family molecular chaperone regulator 2-like [Dermacentor andersoni]
MAASSAHEGGVAEAAQSQVVERLVKLLDQVEKRVELLREHAASLEQERRGLVDTLSSVASSQELASLTPELREEVSLTVERLQTRVKSVDVSVTTPRSEEQETALGQIEQYVTNLVLRMTSDPKGARAQCKAYLSACSTDAAGPVDQKFQAAILGCTADDQKKTRRRLEAILAALPRRC